MTKRFDPDNINEEFMKIDRGVTSAIEDRPQTLFNALEDKDQKKIFHRIFMITSMVLLAVLVLTVSFAGNFDTWISIIGGVGTNLIAFIFPSCFYILATEKKTFKNKFYLLAYFLYIWGWISMTLDLFCIIHDKIYS